MRRCHSASAHSKLNTISQSLIHTQSKDCFRYVAFDMILRKEVIQPHLPIRLPCYDFTPIIGPTFDGCLHKWLAHRLQVLLTFVV